MTRTARAGALAAVSITLAVTLSGCIGGLPVATPTPDAEPPTPTAAPPTPTEAVPSPEAVDPAMTVTAIVARPDALELHDANGSAVVSLDYTGSVDDAIATLSAVLGGPPVEEPYEGGNHFPPGVFHNWDDAFIVDERFYPEGQRTKLPHDLVWPGFAVSFRAPAVRGLDLTTSTHAHAGDAFDALDEPIDPELWTCSGWAVEFIELPRQDHPALKIGVGVSEWAYDVSTDGYAEQVDHVVSIVAPVSVADGCA